MSKNMRQFFLSTYNSATPADSPLRGHHMHMVKLKICDSDFSEAIEDSFGETKMHGNWEAMSKERLANDL